MDWYRVISLSCELAATALPPCSYKRGRAAIPSQAIEKM
jgi:hypothetical protein